jgi:hypothetical protein
MSGLSWCEHYLRNDGVAIMMKEILVVIACVGLFLSCSPKIDKTKFDSLYHAAKAIEASTSVGVNYSDFGRLLKAFATELSIANDKAITKKEKELINAFNDAFRMYKNSFYQWDKKISLNNDQAYAFDDLIQRYWEEGRKELRKATVLYYGK